LLRCQEGGTEMPDHWSHEEIDDPPHADRRNYCKVEKWNRDVE